MNIWSLLSPFSFKLPILSIFLGRRIHTNQLRIRMFGQFYACVLWMRSIFNAKYKILFSSITLAVQFLLKKCFHIISRIERRQNLWPGQNGMLPRCRVWRTSKRRFCWMQLFACMHTTPIRSRSVSKHLWSNQLLFQVRIWNRIWLWKVSQTRILSRFHSHFILSKLILSIHNVSSSTFTQLVIAFKEEQFIPQQRTESQNAIDFIANAGGLVGLCIGASVLSFVELIYYLTLRIFFARQQNDQMIENPTLKAPKATRIYTILP